MIVTAYQNNNLDYSYKILTSFLISILVDVHPMILVDSGLPPPKEQLLHYNDNKWIDHLKNKIQRIFSKQNTKIENDLIVQNDLINGVIPQEAESLLDLPREKIRLDGLTGYGINASLVTVAILGLLLSTPQPSTKLVSYGFNICCFIGILSGVYSTIVFTLCTIYMNSALGSCLDEDYNQFLEETSSYRIISFKNYILSITSFVSAYTIASSTKLVLKTKKNSGRNMIFFTGLTIILVVIGLYQVVILVRIGNDTFLPNIPSTSSIESNTNLVLSTNHERELFHLDIISGYVSTANIIMNAALRIFSSITKPIKSNRGFMMNSIYFMILLLVHTCILSSAYALIIYSIIQVFDRTATMTNYSVYHLFRQQTESYRIFGLRSFHISLLTFLCSFYLSTILKFGGNYTNKIRLIWFAIVAIATAGVLYYMMKIEWIASNFVAINIK